MENESFSTRILSKHPHFIYKLHIALGVSMAIKSIDSLGAHIGYEGYYCSVFTLFFCKLLLCYVLMLRCFLVVLQGFSLLFKDSLQVIKKSMPVNISMFPCAGKYIIHVFLCLYWKLI